MLPHRDPHFSDSGLELREHCCSLSPTNPNPTEQAIGLTSPLPRSHNVTVEVLVEHDPAQAWVAVGLTASTMAEADLLASPYVVGVSSTASAFGAVQSGQPRVWAKQQRLILLVDRMEGVVSIIPKTEDCDVSAHAPITLPLPRGALRLFVAMEGTGCAVSVVAVKAQSAAR